jgi:hypothetical protein
LYIRHRFAHEEGTVEKELLNEGSVGGELLGEGVHEGIPPGVGSILGSLTEVLVST